MYWLNIINIIKTEKQNDLENNFFDGNQNNHQTAYLHPKELSAFFFIRTTTHSICPISFEPDRIVKGSFLYSIQVCGSKKISNKYHQVCQAIKQVPDYLRIFCHSGWGNIFCTDVRVKIHRTGLFIFLCMILYRYLHFLHFNHYHLFFTTNLFFTTTFIFLGHWNNCPPW